MYTKPPSNLRVLLISADDEKAAGIDIALAFRNPGLFSIDRVRLLADGLKYIGEEDTAAILLDLSLPDSDASRTFEEIFNVAPEIPILVLGGENQEAEAEDAVSRGAQDYLLPDHLNSYSLPRALHSAIRRKQVEDALYVEKERAIVTLNSIGDAVLCTNVSGEITYLNFVAETLTGWRHQEALGQLLDCVFNIVDSVSRRRLENPLERAIQENRSVALSNTCLLIRRDGFESAIDDSAFPIHDRKGRIIGAVIVFHDVTVERALSVQLIHAAQFDSLTNLPNRSLLENRISVAISLARRQKASVALLFLDLDHFKYINDSLGHATGDLLLKSVARRLSESVRASDTVSRQGGDEFIILLTQIARSEDAAISAKKILLSLDAPHLIGEQSLHIDASIGSSMFPEDGEDAETLIQNADTAMYRAKESGRNSFKAFKKEMNLKAVARQSLEARLRTAIGNNEFVLYYQPRVNLATGQINSLEALIRWQHPQHGLILPSQFISVAESCGLIVEIGRWVLREACTQVLAWQTAGFDIPCVAVNVSATEMHHENFVNSVRAVLAETGLPGRLLEMEITERVLMNHTEATTALLRHLKGMGIRLAIDDFGTGYSSLSYLHRFVVDTLKIDRSFIKELGAGSNDSAIVTAIISMAKSLGFRVVAEGIETKAQKEHLEALQCTDGQGYFFSRPLPAAQISHILVKRGRENLPTAQAVVELEVDACF